MSKSFSKTLKSDLISGLIVFLIALPLCLGIAQASGASPLAGIISGIIGGLVIGYLSQSGVSVSGPAAGLVAVVLVAIAELGSFKMFLCTVAVAGFIQLLLGFLKAGGIANYLPTSVIEGMLAGIGMTIIIKQIPDAVGWMGAQSGFQLSNWAESFQNIQMGAVLISVLGLVILFLWQWKKLGKLKLIPAGLLVVVLGTLINQMFLSSGNPMYLSANNLVNLPVTDSASEFFSLFSLPAMNGFLNPEVWKFGMIIAVVASIETLLCIEATDKLDPLKRYTSPNRELKAQGIGNLAAGFLGGLPITSVIVRSSANINAGARTKTSAIFHGALLLVCVATLPFVLNMIPKASLAAILIFTGYKLASPAVFVHIWKKGGIRQFVPFVATMVAVVTLDLLKGVSIGLAISIFYLLKENMKIPYFFKRSVYRNSDLIHLRLAQEVSFLNKAKIKETLSKIPDGSKVVIDARETGYIDYDVLQLIRDFDETQSKERDVDLTLIGFKNVYDLPVENQHKNLDHIDDHEVLNKTAGNCKKLLYQLKTQKVN